MEKQKSQNEMLYNSLEKVIFDEEELENLRQSIDRLSKGQCKPIEVKRQILEFRADLLEQLQGIFQFYHNSFAPKPVNHEIHTQLQEKNRLLEEKDTLFEELGKRISNICQRLKDQLQN
ncbi:MAG: hypothetical protein ACFFB0_08535 [Promethearchaeota archaeon]